jgi:RNA polymerase sigma-70 factor (ECF subfamily)
MTSVLARPALPPASIPAECPVALVALDAPVGSRIEPLRAMFDEHAAALLAFAEHFTTHESAQDAVQETFLRAWRNLARLRADPRELRPWLTVVLRRVLIDAHRADRLRAITVAEDAVFDHAVDDGYDRLLERWRLDHALDGLSPSHRQVLVEIYYRDTPGDQLAVDLGIAPGTVRSRQHYALRALRRQLTDAAEERPTRACPTGEPAGRCLPPVRGPDAVSQSHHGHRAGPGALKHLRTDDTPRRAPAGDGVAS